MNHYEFLREVCGLDRVVCEGSCLTDLSYWYEWKGISYAEIDRMVTAYNHIYNKLWEYIKAHKINGSDEEPTNVPKVSMIKPSNGVYFNVLKLDFEKAFTNYITMLADSNFVNVFGDFCRMIAKAYLPRKAKKFLYNYALTNLIVNTRGRSLLYELRERVYNDILYAASCMGEILRTEVDGAYISTHLTEPIIHDTFGKITTTKINWMISLDSILIAKAQGKCIIKGLNKYDPNIYWKLITDVLKADTAYSKDVVVDDFFESDKTHILDWFYKTEDGSKVRFLAEHMDTELESSTPEAIMEYSPMVGMLDRDRYLTEIHPVLGYIFELVG